MLVRLEGKGRLNQRLFRGLRRAIVERRLAPASRLPSTRALAADLGVSRNVVLLAFAQLVAEGYADGRGGSGNASSPRLCQIHISRHVRRARRRRRTDRIRDSRRMRAGWWHSRRCPRWEGRRDPGLVYDFRYGVPAVAEFPQQAWTRLTQRRLRAMSVKTLRYGRALGWLPLREAIADYVTRTRGVAATFEQVVIVNGSQQALDLVARLLIDPGDRVVVEEPSYLSARQVFLAAGAELVSVPVDEAGLDVCNCPGADRSVWLMSPLHISFRLAACCRWRAGSSCCSGRNGRELRSRGRLRQRVLVQRAPDRGHPGPRHGGAGHLRRHILEGPLSVAEARLL